MRNEPAPSLKLLRHAAVCLLFLAASWLFYAPPRAWPDLTYFGDGQDSLAFIWFLNWWPFALTHHLPLLFTHYVDYPTGVDLVWKMCIRDRLTGVMLFGVQHYDLTRLVTFTNYSGAPGGLSLIHI